MIQTADGKWLCEELVKAGLARVYGIRTPFSLASHPFQGKQPLGEL